MIYIYILNMNQYKKTAKKWGFWYYFIRSIYLIFGFLLLSFYLNNPTSHLIFMFILAILAFCIVFHAQNIYKYYTWIFLDFLQAYYYKCINFRIYKSLVQILEYGQWKKHSKAANLISVMIFSFLTIWKKSKKCYSTLN